MEDSCHGTTHGVDWCHGTTDGGDSSHGTTDGRDSCHGTTDGGDSCHGTTDGGDWCDGTTDHEDCTRQPMGDMTAVAGHRRPSKHRHASSHDQRGAIDSCPVCLARSTPHPPSGERGREMGGHDVHRLTIPWRAPQGPNPVSPPGPAVPAHTVSRMQQSQESDGTAGTCV